MVDVIRVCDFVLADSMEEDGGSGGVSGLDESIESVTIVFRECIIFVEDLLERPGRRQCEFHGRLRDLMVMFGC